MIFRGLIKLPAHKQFNYIPRYYDKEKDEQDARRKKRAEALGVELKESNPKATSTIRKGAIKSYYHKKQEESKKISNTRAIIIILVLLLIAVYLLS